MLDINILLRNEIKYFEILDNKYYTLSSVGLSAKDILLCIVGPLIFSSIIDGTLSYELLLLFTAIYLTLFILIWELLLLLPKLLLLSSIYSNKSRLINVYAYLINFIMNEFY